MKIRLLISIVPLAIFNVLKSPIKVKEELIIINSHIIQNMMYRLYFYYLNDIKYIYWNTQS